MRSLKSLRGVPPSDLLAALSHAGLIDPHDREWQGRPAGEWTSRFHDAKLSENIFGTFGLPLSAVLMRVNGRDRVLPIATEEAGIVAGMSKASKLVLPEGFAVEVWNVAEVCGEALVVDVPALPDGLAFREAIGAVHAELFARGFARTPAHPRGLHTMDPPTPVKDWPGAYHLRFRIDPGDAMGAKMALRIAEAGSRLFAERFGGRVVTGIITNHQSGWSVRGTLSCPIGEAGADPERARNVLDLCRWAGIAPTRAVTHNKGVMNGIIAAATAFGQDTRAIEASVASSAYALGECKPLTSYRIADGRLIGESRRFRLPIGTVGGSTSHPQMAMCRRLAGVEGTADFAAVLAAAGMAANFASLFQLASPEGFSDTYKRLG